MKTLTFAPGARGELTFARPPADYIELVVLTNVNQTVTVPPGARFVLFSSTNDFYALPGQPAVLPNVTTTDGLGSELNPGHWALGNHVTIGLIAPDPCVVTLSFYS